MRCLCLLYAGTIVAAVACIIDNTIVHIVVCWSVREKNNNILCLAS
jgi:hypothetical protein